MKFAALALVLALTLNGCVSHSIRDDRRAVRALMQDRVGDLPTPEAEPEDWLEEDVQGQDLLAQPLDAPNAIRLALLRNRPLRARIFELGIARGALVQAGLPSNPTIHAEVRIPEDQIEPEQWDFGFTMDITDAILAPLRANAASSRLEAARLRTAADVLDLAFRVRIAFTRYQAALQRFELLRTSLDAFEASVAAARALHEVGNVRDLDLALEEAAWEEARIAVAEAELALLDQRERLNVLMGLHGTDTSWQAAPRLAEPTGESPSLEALEPRAIETSLELAWTRAEIEAAARSVGLSRAEGLVPEIEVGLHAEFDQTRWELGPELAIGVPIFNQGQGRVLAAEAELDALRERYVGTAIAVRASVRAARNRVLTTETLVGRYRDVLLPARARVFEQTLLQYNAMQVDVFRLLASRREQVDTAMRYVDALRAYWEARATLEQVLAGRMAGAVDSADPGPGEAMSSPQSGGASARGDAH